MFTTTTRYDISIQNNLAAQCQDSVTETMMYLVRNSLLKRMKFSYLIKNKRSIFNKCFAFGKNIVYFCNVLN